MKNLTAKQIKEKSSYALEERLDLLTRIFNLFETYRHVIDPNERLVSMVLTEKKDIAVELDDRELKLDEIIKSIKQQLN